MKAFCISLCLLVPLAQLHAQKKAEEKKVLQVAQQFFDALEKQDTAAFQQIFLRDAHNYYVLDENDSLRVGSQRSLSYKFRPGQIIKERMRQAGVRVLIHDAIAAVWAPYDLWINDDFSHCGVDVFTLMKTAQGWKIASIAYTIERDECEKGKY